MDETTGLPASDPNPQNSVSAMSNPNGAQTSGLIGTLEGWGSSALGDVESAANSAAGAVGATLSSGYSAVKSAGTSAINTAENVVGFGTSQIAMLAIIALVGVYFIAKTGALGDLAKIIA